VELAGRKFDRMFYNNKLHKTGDLVFKALRETGDENQCQLVQIQFAWKKLVGKINAGNSWPYSLKNGTLTIKTRDETWKTVFKSLKSMLTERINNMLNANVIEKLRIQKSVTWDFSEQTRKFKPAVSKSCKTTRIDGKSWHDMEKALLTIQDPELKNLIATIWEKDMAAKDDKQEDDRTE
jgi:hypothetical protein